MIFAFTSLTVHFMKIAILFTKVASFCQVSLKWKGIKFLIETCKEKWFCGISALRGSHFMHLFGGCLCEPAFAS